MNCDFSLKEYQQELISLFTRISDVLKQNNIMYFCAYGTCIGALRHKGIIPWDDDIDITVKREDYKRALDVIRSSCPELFVWDLETDYACDLRYGRVYYRIDGTESLCHYRAYIDIWVMDAVSHLKLLYKTQRFLAALIYRVMDRKTNYKMKPFRWMAKSVFFNVLGLPLRVFPLGFLYYAYSKVAFSDAKTEFYVVGRCRLVKSEWFVAQRWVEFNGLEVPVPIGVEDYLKSIYGDWKKLPPLGERIGNAMSKEGLWLVENPRDEIRMKKNNKLT